MGIVGIKKEGEEDEVNLEQIQLCEDADPQALQLLEEVSDFRLG